MPIYEYACRKCEHEFEVEQRISEDPIKTCPSCRSRQVKRLISLTSFALKGGGWYSDGYSSSNGKSGEKAETSSPESKSESKSAESKSEPSSDSKSSEKSEPKKSGGSDKSKDAA